MKEKLRVIIASGNTVGHIGPGIAVAEELKKQNKDTEVLFVTSKNSKIPDVLMNHKYDYKAIRTKPLVRYVSNISIPRSLNAIIYCTKGLYDSVQIVNEFKPDAVVGTGANPSAFPVLYAALKNIPTLTVVPYWSDFTNKVLAYFADEICIADKKCVNQFPMSVRGSINVTGTPIKNNSVKKDRESSNQHFGLNPSKRTVFITEGSQGCSYMNDIFIDCLGNHSTELDTQFILQTGIDDYERVNYALQHCHDRIKVFDYIDDIGFAYGAADLVVSRGGDTSLSEIVNNHLPSLLLTKKREGQVRVLSDLGAAKSILKKHLTRDTFFSTLQKMLHPSKLDEMREKTQELDKQDCCQNVVDTLYDLVERKKSVRFPQVVSNIKRMVMSPPYAPTDANQMTEDYLAKLVEGEMWSVWIRKKTHSLTLYNYGKGIATYLVGVGQVEGDKKHIGDSRTPEGIFQIKRKVDTGLEDIFGSRWMELDTRYQGFRGIGIHGTNDPDSIGVNSSLGCIKMLNSDVEDVYKKLEKGSKVIITAA